MKLVIGIPTFNRSKYLIQNLHNIETICKETNHLNDVVVFISDNCSTDDTVERIKSFQKTTNLKIDTNYNDINKGISNNLIFILQHGSKKGDFLILLGDDDLFNKTYFQDVFNIIEKYSPACILPNFVPTDNEYNIIGEPREPVSNKTIISSTIDCNLELSLLCHQMSGIVYKCALFSNDYVLPMKSSMYPQIYLAFFLSDKGTFVHLKNNPVLVVQNNSKAWKYDATGYSIDIISGLSYLTISNREKAKLEKRFLRSMSFRLSFGVNHPVKFLKVSNKETRINFSTKLFIFFALQFLFVKKILKKPFHRTK